MMLPIFFIIFQLFSIKLSASFSTARHSFHSAISLTCLKQLASQLKLPTKLFKCELHMLNILLVPVLLTLTENGKQFKERNYATKQWILLKKHVLCSHMNQKSIILEIILVKLWEMLELTHNRCSSLNRIVDSTTEL